MDERYRLREQRPSDAGAVRRLGEASPDGGAVQFRLVEHARMPAEGDGLTRGSRVVAVDRTDDGIIGSATMTTGRFRYEGRERPFALLGALQVHPEHRHHGVGAALAQWRIARAEQVCGAGVVVVADIQKGNVASLAVARRWATSFSPSALTVPVAMLRKPRRAPNGVTVCEARTEDLPAAARGVTGFTAEQNFARIWTPDRLSAWLAWSPITQPVRHYLLAADRRGTILAGLALREEALLRTMELVRMPAGIRVANAFLRVVPKDGRLRNLVVEHLWFEPGAEDAATALWQDVRWNWRTRGSNLVITIDPRSPVRSLLDLRPWTPTTSITTAVRAEQAIDPSRLVAPIQ